MKNKFTRFLCFFLCFALCFAWLGPPQQAHAAGGALVGVLLMFLVGSGIGLGINGTAHSLADGFEELVKSYETNVFDGNLDFWDVLAVGSSIGTMGEVLLDKAATDLLNGFMNWLQTDQGWTEGSEVEISSSSYATFPCYLNNQKITAQTCLVSAPEFAVSGSNTYIRYPVDQLGTFVPFDFDRSDGYFLHPDTFYMQDSGKSYWYGYTSDPNKCYYRFNSTSLSHFLSPRFSAFNSSFSESDISSYVLGLAFVVHDSAVYYGFYTTDGYLYIVYNCYQNMNPSYFTSSSSVVVPSELVFPDTSDWDDTTSFGLFAGHSGKIPESVQEFNDSVLNDLNSGVVPEVSTDVIVGTPDQVLPDEGDGTLAGSVSGILAQVMALPQNIANLLLDGVKSIFIPDPEGVQGAYMDFLEEVNDYYSFDFDLGSLFADAVAPDDIKGSLKISSYSSGDSYLGLFLDDVTFVSWYYLKKGVVYFRPYIRGFIVLMLIYYNLRQFMAIFGLGGVMNGSSGDAQSEAYVGRLMADYMSNYKG